jgi:hypothetical protein
MTDPALRLVPLFAGYLKKVQCDYCATNIFWCDRDAINEAEHQILCCGARDIADLKGNLRRTCSACEHFVNKDD